MYVNQARIKKLYIKGAWNKKNSSMLICKLLWTCVRTKIKQTNKLFFRFFCLFLVLCLITCSALFLKIRRPATFPKGPANVYTCCSFLQKFNTYALNNMEWVSCKICNVLEFANCWLTEDIHIVENHVLHIKEKQLCVIKNLLYP